MNCAKRSRSSCKFWSESSPVAIVTIDSSGAILLANEASQNLLSPGANLHCGPAHRANFCQRYRRPCKRSGRGNSARNCDAGQNAKNGEVFLAAVWFSTYTTARGPRLAAIIVDLSEELRDREDLSLDHLLKNTTILMSAITHEIRNMSGAVLMVHKNLSRLPDLQNNEDFRALGDSDRRSRETFGDGIEAYRWTSIGTQLNYPAILDELRVLLEPSYREAGVEIRWRLQDNLPLVFADRYGLAQVFLNLSSKQPARHGERHRRSS